MRCKREMTANGKRSRQPPCSAFRWAGAIPAKMKGKHASTRRQDQQRSFAADARQRVMPSGIAVRRGTIVPVCTGTRSNIVQVTHIFQNGGLPRRAYGFDHFCCSSRPRIEGTCLKHMLRKGNENIGKIKVGISDLKDLSKLVLFDEALCRHCERNEAIQTAPTLDCFAPLAMTTIRWHYPIVSTGT